MDYIYTYYTYKLFSLLFSYLVYSHDSKDWVSYFVSKVANHPDTGLKQHYVRSHNFFCDLVLPISLCNLFIHHCHQDRQMYMRIYYYYITCEKSTTLLTQPKVKQVQQHETQQPAKTPTLHMFFQPFIS